MKVPGIHKLSVSLFIYNFIHKNILDSILLSVNDNLFIKRKQNLMKQNQISYSSAIIIAIFWRFIIIPESFCNTYSKKQIQYTMYCRIVLCVQANIL